ncbi:hypothetical protein [Streptomyces globisporus]|uniref:hypothetical protein n=1 Tax=Streptomyces globisporus TaxID=1908 RepID=UPI003F4CC867
MFVLGVVGVCCWGGEEWVEAAVQRVEADERVKVVQAVAVAVAVAVDDGERWPVGREEHGEDASLTLHERAGFRVIGRHHRHWRDVVLLKCRSPTVT